MGRFRSALVALVVVGLVVPAADANAATRETESDCRPPASFSLLGTDGSSQVATYTLTASWCVERVFESSSEPEPEPSGTPSSGQAVAQDRPTNATMTAASADDTTQLKRKGKNKRGRKGKKAKKRRRGGNQREDTEPRSRTSRNTRRLVSTCITSFSLTPSTTGRDGVVLLGATTKEVTGSDACATRTFEVEGRFGRDYIAGVPSFTRSVITQHVSGTSLENYPLGRVGYFRFTVQFHRDSSAGQCMSTGCQTPFEFCDLRIVTGDDDSCVRL